VAPPVVFSVPVINRLRVSYPYVVGRPRRATDADLVTPGLHQHRVGGALLVRVGQVRQHCGPFTALINLVGTTNIYAPLRTA